MKNFPKCFGLFKKKKKERIKELNSNSDPKMNFKEDVSL